MAGYPKMITRLNHVESVPRRIRAVLGGHTLLDTTNAWYVWEWANYPQFYVPQRDVREELLVTDGRTEDTPRGTVELYWPASTGADGPPLGRLLLEATRGELTGTYRFDWDGLDRWYEEDEEVFVHPRNPYTRVDALRSTRTVRVELEGVVLAESTSPVMVFETGLPPRRYLNRTEVRFEHLTPTATVTRCPYKGTATGYWSVVIGGTVHTDLAWSYDFPTRQLLPIAGLVAFYDEKVDTFVDGVLQDRPRTHFSD
ncbi:MAG: DUF427 domain-containing protein [Acidimicrobiales bacterium]